MEKADIIALMKEVTGMPYAFFVKTRDVDGGEYGNLILSKYPISDEVNYDLPIDVEDVYPRSMGVVKTEKDGKGFYFGVTCLMWATKLTVSTRLQRLSKRQRAWMSQ